MLPIERFLQDGNDGSFYVGHATVLARVGGRLILIDPVLERPLFSDSWLFYPPLVKSPLVRSVDAVLVSHHHEDHYDPDFLRQLSPGTPIYVTEGCTGFDEIEQDSRLDVRRLKRSKFTSIFSDVEVFAIPSDHNDFDSSFIVRGPRFSVFQGNDNFVSRSVMEGAVRITGPVDHAYIPYAYVWWYPFCLTSLGEDERNAEADRLTHLNMDIGLMMAEVLEARHVIPSAGNLILCDDADSATNRGIATPFDFHAYALTKGPEIAKRVRVLLAGDYILEDGGGSKVVSRNETKEIYFERMAMFLDDYHVRNPAHKRTDALSEEEITLIRSRIEQNPPPDLDYVIYVKRDDMPDNLVTIDTRTGQVALVDEPENHPKFLSFEVQGPPFDQWLSGQIPFEVILNSQRFSVFRQPEVFEKPLWDYIRNHL